MSMIEALGAGQKSGRATRGHTPIFRITVLGELLDVNVLEATLNLGENMHDTGTLRVTSATRTTTEGLLEQPISFLYGSAPKTEVFCGYITEITEVQNESGSISWTMEVTGPTKLMQVGSPRFWPNRTIPSAVDAMACIDYLGFISHDSSYIWPSLAQTEDSDWKTCVNLAKRLGWSIFNRYGVVALFDPLQLFMNNGIAARLVSETYNLAKDSLDEERALVEFTPVEQAESSANQQGYKVAYFSGDRVQVALQAGDHSSYKFLNNVVVRSPEEAALYVNARASYSANWRQSATARILGNASLFPGMSVEVVTSNKQSNYGKFNGRWFVRGVQHKMDKQNFQSNLVLARPGEKLQVYAGGYAPFWEATTKARPTLSLTQAITQSEGQERWANIWMSSWSDSSARDVA